MQIKIKFVICLFASTVMFLAGDQPKSCGQNTQAIEIRETGLVEVRTANAGRRSVFSSNGNGLTEASIKMVGPKPETKSAETRRLLEELDSFVLETVKLTDLIKLLNPKLPHGCLIDFRSLEEEGIDASTVRCDWSLTNATMGTMLEMVLDPLDLTYRIKDGILVIVSKTAAEDELELVVYDAKFLFDSIIVVEQNIAEDVVRQLVNQRPLGQPVGDLESLRVTIERYLEKFGPRAEEQRLNRVCSLIESMVDPRSWENNGGVATLSRVGDRLLVRQTERTHRKLRKLLDELAAAAD